MTRKGWSKRLVRWAMFSVIGFLAFTLLPVLAFRWVDPPTSAVMFWHALSARLGADHPVRLHHEWVDWERIPQEVALAVIAAEDQRFPVHRGFDLVEIRKAMERFQGGGRLRGASTISQQTAKNLFLWSGRDYARKGLEAWLTVLIETFWPKQRILEVYLNIAQFGPETYGVGAASWRYLNRPISAVDEREAALLAAVLPNPNIYRLEAPSPAVRRRAHWVNQQMRQLGGANYLKKL